MVAGSLVQCTRHFWVSGFLRQSVLELMPSNPVGVIVRPVLRSVRIVLCTSFKHEVCFSLSYVMRRGGNRRDQDSQWPQMELHEQLDHIADYLETRCTKC